MEYITNGSIDDEGKISALNGIGKYEIIGVSKAKYNEVATLCDEYEQMLIDAGIIQPEKSAEEMNQELSSKVSGLEDQISQMANMMQQLINNQNGVLMNGNQHSNSNENSNGERGGRPAPLEESERSISEPAQTNKKRASSTSKGN